jgi:hypothetical protein
MVGRPGRPGSGVLHPVGATSNFLFGDSEPLALHAKRCSGPRGWGVPKTSPSHERVGAEIRMLTIRLWSNARNQCARASFEYFDRCCVRSAVLTNVLTRRARKFVVQSSVVAQFYAGNFDGSHDRSLREDFFALDLSPSHAAHAVTERQSNTAFLKVPLFPRLQKYCN